MAAIAMSAAVAPATFAAASATKSSSQQTVSAFFGLKSGVSAGSAFSSKTVSNGSRISCMKVSSHETFQIQYFIENLMPSYEHHIAGLENVVNPH